MGKIIPGTDRSIPYENGDVEKHVDGGLKRVVQSLQSEPVTVDESERSRQREDGGSLTPR